MRPRLDPSAKVHLVGIGGAGMSALAFILLERGHPVSGSDLRGGRLASALEAMGAQVHIGHDAAHVEGADVVVSSTAIPPGNTEVVRAAELGLPVWRRADLLAALMTDRKALLVAGTHGKTTTTSLLTICLQAAGLDPSFAIGGTLQDAGTSAHAGSGDFFVAEADESDRSFLVLEPDAAVVTNVELDHHDHYNSLDEVREAFVEFLARRGSDAGPAVICRDDPGAWSLVEVAGEPVLTYGEHPDAHLRIIDLEPAPTGTRFGLELRGESLGTFAIHIPGRHNVLNAAAAAGLALWAGVGSEDLRRGLATFRGAQRRFHRLGQAAGVTVVDDYGHHPTEIEATLQAARQIHPEGRVVAVFQPHRFSRTAALGAELGSALAGADLVVVTDVYGSGEAPVPGIDGTVVADGARAAGATVEYIPATGDLAPRVADLVASGDLVLTLGAGDITEVGPVLLGLLEGRRRG